MSEDGGGVGGRGALVALVVLVVIVIGGVFLSGALRSTGRLQDCAMAGRTNCTSSTP